MLDHAERGPAEPGVDFPSGSGFLPWTRLGMTTTSPVEHHPEHRIASEDIAFELIAAALNAAETVRDPTLTDHEGRVGRAAERLARSLGLPGAECRTLGL